MTSTPYSDQWREHVRRVLFEHGSTAAALAERTGLGDACIEAVLGAGAVNLEVAGPIDEALGRLDDGLEGRTAARSRARLTRPPVRPGELYKVEWADVGALDGARVQLARVP